MIGFVAEDDAAVYNDECRKCSNDDQVRYCLKNQGYQLRRSNRYSYATDSNGEDSSYVVLKF
jgi:hypothetical protein